MSGKFLPEQYSEYQEREEGSMGTWSHGLALHCMVSMGWHTCLISSVIIVSDTGKHFIARAVLKTNSFQIKVCFAFEGSYVALKLYNK